MSNRPRLKVLAVCIGAALVQMSGAALADSGTGVDTTIGNSSNMGYQPGLQYKDPNWVEVKRTPSGQMYSFPVAVDPPVVDAVTGSVEAGYLVRNDRQRYSKLNEYRDPQEKGFLLNNFDLSYESSGPFYIQMNGGGVGRDDQFYNLTVGQYNTWKIKAFYNETPHVFSNTWRPAWEDNGTPWVSVNFNRVAASTPAAIAAAIPATGEVGLMRKKGGARGEFRLNDSWKFFASATQENRDGSRPWGSQSGYETVEPVHYITRNFLAGVNFTEGAWAANLTGKYDTFRNDIKQFYTPRTGAANQAIGGLNKYSSYPDNEQWELKGEVSYKLPEFLNSRFNATVAFGEIRQDDNINTPLPQAVPGLFTPAVSTVGALPAFLGQPAGTNSNPYWDGTNGSPTSRATGGMKVETRLINLSWVAKPIKDLGLKASYRHWEYNNKSGTYYAYNPLTGQWGVGIQEEAGNTALYSLMGNAAACLAPPGFALPAACAPAQGANSTGARGLAAPPRSYKQDNAVLGLNYSLGDAWGDVEASVEREEFKRTYRERDKTWEDKYKLGYTNLRGLDSVTVRGTYEYDRKRGSFYDPLVSGRFIDNYLLSQGLLPNGSVSEHRAAMQQVLNSVGQAGMLTLANFTGTTTEGNTNIAAPGGMQKTDQADRNQQILNLRVNYQAMDALDIGFNTQLKRVAYPVNLAAKLGTFRDDLDSYTLDFNYQPAPETQIYGYYTRQSARQTGNVNYAARNAAAVNAFCPAIAVGSSIDDVYCRVNNARERGNANQEDTRTINDVFGFGVQQDVFAGMRFGLDYSLNLSSSIVAYTFATGVLSAANTAAVSGWGGSALPEMQTRQQTVEASLLIPIAKQLTGRLMYRYDGFSVRDWHYDYAPDVLGAHMLNDMGPKNFNTNTFGVFLRYKM